MAALRVRDFDMLRRRVNVSRSVTESSVLVWSTPKSWERRSVPFPPALAAGLAALMIGKRLRAREASMTLDVYADLFDEDLDDVAANLDAAIRSAAYPLRPQIGAGTGPDG